MRIEASVSTVRRTQLREQRFNRGGFLRECPQDVEADHVPGALPDRIERRLAIQARHSALLHVPIAAEALQRLAHHYGRTLADPIFRDGRGDAPESGFLRRVVSAGQAHGEE